MVKYFSADYVVPVSTQPIKNGVVAIDAEGEVVSITDIYSLPANINVERLEGVLIPGFINTHCHLELSHMQGKIETNLGLVKFIEEVMSSRKDNDSTIEEAMSLADKKMYDNGIQAIGDHVNSAISAKVKENSNIQYHTFVEIIGLNDDQINDKIDEARDIEFNFDPKHSSITIHAPYSSSKKMLKTFKKSVSEDNIVLSLIHI